MFSKLRQSLTGSNGEKLVLLGQWLKYDCQWFAKQLRLPVDEPPEEIARVLASPRTAERGAGAGAAAASSGAATGSAGSLRP